MNGNNLNANNFVKMTDIDPKNMTKEKWVGKITI